MHGVTEGALIAVASEGFIWGYGLKAKPKSELDLNNNGRYAMPLTAKLAKLVSAC
jgi:hypothetical protein